MAAADPRRDVARAALALLAAPEDAVRGEAFNVGSDAQNYLIRDLAELLSELTGCEVEFAEGSSADARSYRVDFSQARARRSRSSRSTGMPAAAPASSSRPIGASG